MNTPHHVLAALGRLLDLHDELARQMCEVIGEAHPDDRVALLEGLTTIEVGHRHLTDEMTRAAGDLPRVVLS